MARPPFSQDASRSAFATSAEKRRDALTHDQIAEDLAAFEQAGGKIEKLGNTPLRRAIPLAASAPPADADGDTAKRGRKA